MSRGMALDDSVIAEIDAFLEKTGMSATAFGKSAVGDPNFVKDLRAGREPRRRVVEKVSAFIEANKELAQ